MSTADFVRRMNRTERRIANARADFREARHYYDDACRRARRTAKREAKRAARRLPIAIEETL